MMGELYKFHGNTKLSVISFKIPAIKYSEWVIQVFYTLVLVHLGCYDENPG